MAVVSEHVDHDVALLPEFLPPDVVRVFRRAGTDVRFYPVNWDLTLPVDEVRECIETAESAVVVFAHYFGFADPNYRTLLEVAREAGAFVVEDVARGLFARDGDGRLLGSTGDLSVFSLHKVLPVPYGGLVTARSLTIPKPEARVADHGAIAMSVGVAGARLVDWLPLSASDGVPQIGPLDGIASPDERRPLVAPGRISRLGLARSTPSEIQSRRLARYADFYDRLIDLDGLEVLSPAPYAGACPYGVAVHVRGGGPVCYDVFRALRRRSLPADVFRWPTPYGAEEQDAFPDAVTIRESTLVVPTHQQLPHAAIEPIVRTVSRNL